MAIAYSLGVLVAVLSVMRPMASGQTTAGEDGVLSGGVQCAITGAAPAKPNPLSFCHKYNDDSCCAPAIDAENIEMFENMMSIGLSCRQRGDVRQHPTAKLYCMNCDPQQPQYLRPEPWVPLGINADEENVVWTLKEYKDGKAGVSAPALQGSKDTTILICEDWALKQYGTTNLKVAASWCENNKETYDCSVATNKIPDLLAPAEDSERMKTWETDGNNYMRQSIFKDCGYMKSSPCLSESGALIGDRDRFFCGDDFILPEANYESLEELLNANDFGPPGLDDFGFKIVANRTCTDEELKVLDDLVTSDDDQVSGTDAHATNEFSLHNPNCLRTVEQIETYGYSDYADDTTKKNYAKWKDAGFKDMFIRPEKCFGAGATSQPSVVLALVAAAVAVLQLL